MGLFPCTSHFRHHHLYRGPFTFGLSWRFERTHGRKRVVAQAESLLQSGYAVSRAEERHEVGHVDGHQPKRFSFRLDRDCSP